MMSGGNGSIKKGYILKARKIEDSAIAHASPCTREVWDLMLRKANFKDQKCGQTTIKRGQWLTSYDEIRELLHWRLGYRKMRYTRDQIKAATVWLRSRLIVRTSKATRGFFITVVNYDTYQEPDNYGRPDGHTNDAPGKRRRGKKGKGKAGSFSEIEVLLQLFSQVQADTMVSDRAKRLLADGGDSVRSNPCCIRSRRQGVPAVVSANDDEVFYYVCAKCHKPAAR
jgi:hypothetical protein